jgi:hypothetical protein
MTDLTPNDGPTPQQVFDDMWDKHEPIAKRMFQDAMEFLADQVLGLETGNTVQTHLRMAYVATLNAYAVELTREADETADFRTTIEDMNTGGLTDE